MPGLVPLLSGLGFLDKAHGLDSTGFRRARWNGDSDRRPASLILSSAGRKSPLPVRGERPGEGAGRQAGGANAAICSVRRVQRGGGRSPATVRARREALPRPLPPNGRGEARPTPNRLCPMAEPDSNGTSPGRRCGDGHDGKRAGAPAAFSCHGMSCFVMVGAVVAALPEAV